MQDPGLYSPPYSAYPTSPYSNFDGLYYTSYEMVSPGIQGMHVPLTPASDFETEVIVEDELEKGFEGMTLKFK
jgi:hypothetical protein